MIDLTDGTNFPSDLPIFVMARRSDHPVGILYPDFTFFSWPESVCPPERSHAYGQLYDKFTREALEFDKNPEQSWAAKQDTLFWRGGQIPNNDRTIAVQFLQGVPGVDVKFMDWKSNSITGQNIAPGCVGLLDHCKYRYLAFLNGKTYSSRLKYNLLCGSCVFASRPQYLEWWTHLLTPGEDYIEMNRSDFGDASIRLREVRGRADGGRSVAERGRNKALSLLSEEAVDCYWARLFDLASKYLPRTNYSSIDALPANARPIEDILLQRGGRSPRREELSGP